MELNDTWKILPGNSFLICNLKKLLHNTTTDSNSNLNFNVV